MTFLLWLIAMYLSAGVLVAARFTWKHRRVLRMATRQAGVVGLILSLLAVVVFWPAALGESRL